MTEVNNTIEINAAHFQRTLKELSAEVRQRPGVQGLPRIYFQDGNERYALLLQENNQGFNVSGTLNNAVSYQLNNTIFSRGEVIGNVILKIANASAGTTAEVFFA